MNDLLGTFVQRNDANRSRWQVSPGTYVVLCSWPSLETLEVNGGGSKRNGYLRLLF